MKIAKIKLALLFSLLLFFVGCVDLNVENENNPDFQTAVSKPTDINGIAAGLVRRWFIITHEYDGPALGLWVAADAGTCSWGNAGMRVLSNEPRNPFNNTPSYADAQITNNYYNGLNSMLSQANDVLLKIEQGGMNIVIGGVDNTQMVKAVAYFAQGISLGYLGLLYDKAYIVTHETNLEEGVTASPFADVINAALISLDKAITICEENNFTLPGEWIPANVTFTSANFGKLANSFAARILAYSPRNASQNSAIDWNKVYNYANKGIDYDFEPIADNINWYSYYHIYANYSGWGMTDMRVVNMLDPRFPNRWPGENGFNEIPAPITDVNDPNIFDKRVVTDFEFMSSCPFRPERGYYHFSSYRFKRRDTYVATEVGPMADFYKAENDLLKAEACLFVAGKLAEGADIINNGTRVTRGGLPAVAADATAIANAIYHERNIELYCSGFGIEFFTLRKANKLQTGTFLHWPIPGAQLQILNAEYYTFGGNQGTPGVDVSNGGW